jgi:hypothetical protein
LKAIEVVNLEPKKTELLGKKQLGPNRRRKKIIFGREKKKGGGGYARGGHAKYIESETLVWETVF